VSLKRGCWAWGRRNGSFTVVGVNLRPIWRKGPENPRSKTPPEKVALEKRPERIRRGESREGTLSTRVRPPLQFFGPGEIQITRN